MATMTSSTPKSQTPLSTGQMTDTDKLLQGKGPYDQGLRETEKEKEKDAQQGKPTQKKTYPECGNCGKKNHPEERCRQGAGAHQAQQT